MAGSRSGEQKRTTASRTISISADSRRLATVVDDGKQKMVVVDGLEGNRYDDNHHRWRRVLRRSRGERLAAGSVSITWRPAAASFCWWRAIQNENTSQLPRRPCIKPSWQSKYFYCHKSGSSGLQKALW
jgi:hypothetical protein